MEHNKYLNLQEEWFVFFFIFFGLENNLFIFTQANLTYVIFIVAFNLSLVILFKLSEKLCGPIDSLLVDGLGRNGLIMFLLANLLTGATNLSIHTLYVSDTVAFIVLLTYLTTLAVAASVLHVYNVTIKFW